MNEAIQKIEEILNITLEPYHYTTNPPNAYAVYRDQLNELILDRVTIESVDELRPYLKYLSKLTISNSTVSNLSELFKLEISMLRMRNVVFTQENYDESVLAGIELTRTPYEVYISNMRLDAASFKDCAELKFLFLNNCHVQNVYAVCGCPELYQLNLTEVTFGESQSLVPARRENGGKLLVTLKGCTVEKQDFFLPFAECVTNIYIYDSRLQNLDDLSQFPYLQRFRIDHSTEILHQDVIETTSSKIPQSSIRCEFSGKGKTHSLEKLASIAASFKTLVIQDCNIRKLTGIERFANVEHLRFEKCTVRLDSFLPIAPHIKSVEFMDSALKTPHLWKHFTALETFETLAFDYNKSGIKSLKKVLPLANQLKRLIVMEKLKDGEKIKIFSSLEVLVFHDISFRTAKKMRSLKSLRKLSFNIRTGKKRKLNLSRMGSLEHLQILDSLEVKFKGINQLKKLESLVMKGGELDVNHLQPMPSLKRLVIDNGNYPVTGLSHFPNLEMLQIESAEIIQLKGLHKLRILDLCNCVSVQAFDFFDDLPELEKLCLPEMTYDNREDFIQLECLKNLKNLKWLSLKETTLKSLDGIENLSNLEYLDLYQTGVTDVKVLNELKNLKEVNLATVGEMESRKLKHQLERPEIAIFLFVPYKHFSIWEGIDFDAD